MSWNTEYGDLPQSPGDIFTPEQQASMEAVVLHAAAGYRQTMIDAEMELLQGLTLPELRSQFSAINKQMYSLLEGDIDPDLLYKREALGKLIKQKENQ